MDAGKSPAMCRRPVELMVDTCSRLESNGSMGHTVRGPQAIVQVSHQMFGGRSNALGVALCLWYAARRGHGKHNLAMFKKTLLAAYKSI